MTIVPEYRKCPRCKQKYSWNPDVGKMWCPMCGPLANSDLVKNPIKKIAKAVRDAKKQK